MELINVKAKNFLSLETLDLALNDRGLVLLEGNNLDSNGFQSNGSGKSSIMESITYALYGKLSNGTAGDNIINRQAGKGTYVILTFKIGTVEYRIERYRKHKEFKNKVLLFINNEERTQASLKETNAMIQEIISIDISTYLNSIIFGQGDIKRFSQSTDKEKKAILEDIANITVYKKAQEVAKGLRDGAKSALAIRQAELTSAQTILNSALANKEDEDTAYEQAMAYKESLKSQLANSRLALGERKKIIPTENEIANLDKQLSEVSVSISALQAVEPTTTISANDLMNLKMNIQQAENELAQYSSILNKDKEAITTLSTSPNPTCNYCGSILDADHRQQELNRLMTEARDAQEKGLEIKNQLPTAKEQMAKIQAQYDEELTAQSEAQSKITALYEQQQQLNSKKSSYNFLIQEIASLEKAVEDSKQRYSEYKVSKPKSQTSKLKQLEQAVEVAQNHVNEESSKLNEYSEVVDVYSNKGVRAHVMDLVTPFLTQQANKYLSILTDGTLSVIIEINAENDSLELKVSNINGADEYELNSKGEKKRIDLAISLAMQDYVMSRSNIKPNFIGYDEVFDGLDGIGIERIMTVLKERVKEIPSIFVISHNSNLKELFETTITVEKKGGVAHVVAN